MASEARRGGSETSLFAGRSAELRASAWAGQTLGQCGLDLAVLEVLGDQGAWRSRCSEIEVLGDRGARRPRCCERDRGAARDRGARRSRWCERSKCSEIEAVRERRDRNLAPAGTQLRSGRRLRSRSRSIRLRRRRGGGGHSWTHPPASLQPPQTCDSIQFKSSQ